VGVPVTVPVMQIGIMRMPMHDRRMTMPVRMRLSRRYVGPMLMLVMIVVPMPVLVLRRVMNVLVIVLLGQVQPESETHQTSRDK
jgi:hypothetical protein